MKRFNIPLRSDDKTPILRKGQIGYGKRKEKGKLVEHKREQEYLDRMKELRRMGFSYHKIADVFNTMGIKTKNGGKRWHATTIMKILKSMDNKLK